MSDVLSRLDLAFNPFEPAASGPPVGIAISPPDPLAERLRNFVKTGHHAPGPKVFVILGGYGTGKTCLLRWLHDRLLPGQRIKPFYFDNPGVHFYDLANTLLRTIGRKDFAKFIWEFAGPHLSTPYQRNLFRQSFEEYLTVQSRPRRGGRQDVVEPLQKAIMSAGVTSDEEIAHCLARIVTDAVRKPIGANLFSPSSEVVRELRAPAAWRLRERIGDRLPFADHVRQRKRRLDAAPDLVEHELEVTPRAGRTPAPAERSPRGKSRGRARAAFPPAAPRTASRTATPWRCRRRTSARGPTAPAT